MNLNLIAVGTRMPSWVDQGYQEYVKRLPKEWHFNLIEIQSIKRPRTAEADILKITEQEGLKIIAAIPSGNLIIAFERSGNTIDTLNLSHQLSKWQLEGISVSFLIGGPEGLSPRCCQKANAIWSLSALTLPHPLVRIVLVEQLYRAYTILQNHPYHR